MKQEGKEYEMRKREVEDMTNAWFGRFMKLLEVKVHYHEIEVYHVSSWFQTLIYEVHEIGRTL